MPGDRTVVLGLVSSKVPRLESADDLRRRIDEAAKIVPLERLALSPQCGFASTHEGNRLTPEDQRKKLELVARTAKKCGDKSESKKLKGKSRHKGTSRIRTTDQS